MFDRKAQEREEPETAIESDEPAAAEQAENQPVVDAVEEKTAAKAPAVIEPAGIHGAPLK